MEITNKKMTILSIIVLVTVIINAIYTRLSIRAQKLTDEKVSRLQRDVINLRLENISQKTTICSLLEDITILLRNMRRIFVVVDLIGLATSPSIGKTVTQIMRTDEIFSPREANILLLKNLTIEYGEHIYILEQKVDTAEDKEDKERLTKILEEFKNMVTLLSTISNESSNEYINQIFQEVILGVTKIKNV